MPVWYGFEYKACPVIPHGVHHTVIPPHLAVHASECFTLLPYPCLSLALRQRTAAPPSFGVVVITE